jgi:hypothetical protein
LEFTENVEVSDIRKKFDVWIPNFKQMKIMLNVDYDKTAEKLKQHMQDTIALRLTQQNNGAAGGPSTAAAAATGATQMDGLQKYKEWMWRTLPLSVRNQILPGDNQTREGFQLLVQLHDWYEPLVQHFASQLGLASNTGVKERKSALDKWIEQMDKVKTEIRVGTYSEIPAAVRRQLQNGATPAVTVPDASAASGNTPAARAPDALSAVVGLNMPVQHEIEELKRQLYDMQTKLTISQRRNGMLEQRLYDAENGSFEPSRHFQVHEKLSNLLDELNNLLKIDFATDPDADGERMVNQIHHLIYSALAGTDVRIGINSLVVRLMQSLYPHLNDWDVELVVTKMEETLNNWNTHSTGLQESVSDNTGHEPVQALTRGDEAVQLAQPVTSATDQAATAQPSARDGSAAPRDEAGASHAAAVQSSARGNSAATSDPESRDAGARAVPSTQSGIDGWYKRGGRW